jgi:hypothetical protein
MRRVFYLCAQTFTRPEFMTQQLPRSLKYEYELYVEREIENYKDSIPRSAILSIGDEAVAVMRGQDQFVFDELLLWAEVDRIIRKRLRIPSYSTWRRRRVRLLEEYRRPEHWGMQADAPIVRSIDHSTESHILVAGTRGEGSALYLAANGCVVTAVEQEPEVVARMMNGAEEVGLGARLTSCSSTLGQWTPDGPLNAVVCTPAAFAGLSDVERARVIEVLQGATVDGGVHLVETIIAGQTSMTLDELRSRYSGWAISVERENTVSRTFTARKGVA